MCMHIVLFEAVFLLHKHLLQVSLVYQYSSGASKWTAVLRSECSVKYPRPVYALQPLSHGANTVYNIHESSSLALFLFYNYQWRPVIKSLSVLHFGYHHYNILPKGRSFSVNSETKATVLLKNRSSNANSGTQAAVLLGVDRCGSFPMLFAPLSLFST